MALLPQEQMEALEILGHVYFLLGRAREARIVFNGVLALDDGNASALGHLAALDMEQGRSEDALRLLDEAARKRDAPAIRLMRAQALAQAGRRDEARQAMAAYVDLASSLSGDSAAPQPIPE
ncbi:MAG: tetratricopeptide repeat protein [Desulfovibrio sp.]|jgi:predicted Zn-dependent protease|nr:tetratricopeptide repeat protein [Desulfovibrio sp.]